MENLSKTNVKNKEIVDILIHKRLTFYSFDSVNKLLISRTLYMKVYEVNTVSSPTTPAGAGLLHFTP